MAHVADHLSVSALEQQYRSCTDVTAARHFQTIWLLAKGHDLAQVSATVSYARRWVERLLARYNAGGPQALGDLRRRTGASSSVLKPDLLEKLKARLLNPPPDGGLWTSPKVAAWMAGELGLAEVLPQRGWEALKAIGWSVQKPRPRHPASATCRMYQPSLNRPASKASTSRTGSGCLRPAGHRRTSWCGSTGRSTKFWPSPTWSSSWVRDGSQATPMSVDQFAAFLKSESSKYEGLLRDYFVRSFCTAGARDLSLCPEFVLYMQAS